MGEISYLPLIEDMTWSFSRLKSFDECRYGWFLKYIDNIPGADQFYASYGTFIHKLIEQFYTGKLSREELPAAYLTGFSENVLGDRPKTETVQKYITSGANYFSNFKQFECEPIAVEKKVNFQVGSANFTGIIDYVGAENGELYVIDHKSRDLKPRSRRKKPTKKDEELDDMSRQLYLYAISIKKEYGQFPKYVCFNCYRTQTIIKSLFDERKYDETIKWATDKIDEIKETDDFYPNLDYFYCNWICGVSDHCVYHQMEEEGRRRGR